MILASSSPPSLRQISRKVGYLRDLLRAGEIPDDTLWLTLLARFVDSANTQGQFSDILSDPRIVDLPYRSVDDVLADSSIAEKSVIYEFLLAYAGMRSKRDNGQFFTPDDVAHFMAQQAHRLADGVWLDPCSGVGNLAYWLAAEASDPEAFLLTRLLLRDVDGQALFSARVFLTVAFHDNEDLLFTQLESRCQVADFLATGLLAPDQITDGYDFVIMNPPYVQTSTSSRAFEAAASRDLYAFFMERALKTSKGVVAITPQTFTNGTRHQALRQVILRSATDCRIYCFDNVPDTIFKGFKFGTENSNQVNSTRAAVTVAVGESSPPTGGSPSIRCTPLIRWTSAQRGRLFDVVDDLLARPILPIDDLFPKVPKGLEDLYEEMACFSIRLQDLATPVATSWILNVPTTPRYFISATARNLSRSSMARIFFPDEASWRHAYLIVNSSLAYFWWRALDGGMTLSRRTLFSCPIIRAHQLDTEHATDLCRRLNESEDSNLVVKMNAGKANENVKHPLDLVREVNLLVVPEYADALCALHENSSLSAESCLA